MSLRCHIIKIDTWGYKSLNKTGQHPEGGMKQFLSGQRVIDIHGLDPSNHNYYGHQDWRYVMPITNNIINIPGDIDINNCWYIRTQYLK